MTDPFSELIVHHEVVDVFLGSSQLQLASEDGHHQRRTAGTLDTYKFLITNKHKRSGVSRKRLLGLVV